MRRIVFPIAASFAAFFLSLVLIRPLFPIDEEILSLHYRVRGAQPADTSIVVLYFDNDDIAALGGWPLKRNIYALLLDVLDRSGAAAIGFDIFFGEEHREFPEYDRLMAATAARNGKVVFACYFRGTSTDITPSADIPEHFVLPAPDYGLAGVQLQPPIPILVQSAAGLGHANVVEGAPPELPLFLRAGEYAMPAFSLELFRVARGLRREDVSLAHHAVGIGGQEISLSGNGTFAINVPGPFSAFRRYRCVEVLRSFEMQLLGIPPAVDPARFQKKIVLISVVAEGRSTFFRTPFEQSFPAVGLHAAALDNFLQQRYVRPISSMSIALLSLVLGALCAFVIRQKGVLQGLVVGVSVLCLVYGISLTLFITGGLWMPVTQIVTVVGVVVLGVSAYEYRLASTRLQSLEVERRRLETDLNERELKLQLLENEISSGSDGDNAINLLEEIKRYKREIREYAVRVADLVPSSESSVVTAGPREFYGIVYDGTGKMAEIIELITKVAPSDSPVLILGESGTGKELVARAIHALSGRAAKPFVPVNCAAIQETLLESELFGHMKGSFTGAIADKAGLFEVANGGTILLDEISETSDAFQAKLLRVLQEKEIQRVGASSSKKVDVRVLASTNKNIEELLAQKKFREDLYFRVNVFQVYLPPLRERKGDIPELARYFLLAESPRLTLSSTAMEALMRYDWPGNVRQLQGAIKRAAVFATTARRTLVQLHDLPPEIAETVRTSLDLEDQIVDSLRAKKFSRSAISETADALGGLNRGTVAEYFRGYCFKTLFESSWDIDRTVRQIAGTDDPETLARVRKKLLEYLSNLVEGISRTSSPDALQPALKPKMKNLPQRYHSILEHVVRAYLEGKWTTL